MKVIGSIAIVAAVLLPLGAFLLLGASSHGHILERLDLSVRLVDAETGEPMGGRRVAAAHFRSMLDSSLFEWCWSRPPAEEPRRIAVATLDANGTATILAAVCVTRYWTAGIETSKSVYGPSILVVDHPQHGLVVVAVPEDAEFEPGAEPDTWTLNLGTLRVQRDEAVAGHG